MWKLRVFGTNSIIFELMSSVCADLRWWISERPHWTSTPDPESKGRLVGRIPVRPEMPNVTVCSYFDMGSFHLFDCYRRVGWDQCANASKSSLCLADITFGLYQPNNLNDGSWCHCIFPVDIWSKNIYFIFNKKTDNITKCQHWILHSKLKWVLFFFFAFTETF